MHESWAEFLTEVASVDLDHTLEGRRSASTDLAWAIDTAVPLAVARCRTVEDVACVMRAAYRHRIPVVPRGAGTGLSGGANAADGGIVVDLSGMNRIISIDALARTAVVEPGVINQHLDMAAATHGLSFAPDPASSAISTVGGNIATNAGGLRCVKYGAARASTLGLRVVLGDGRIVDLGGSTRKNATGLDLLGLMVGSEGTLGVIVEATVALIPRPEGTQMTIACFDDDDALEQATTAAIATGVVPALFEMMDRTTLGSVGAQLLDELGVESLQGGLLILTADGSGATADIERIRLALALPGVSVSRVLTASEAEKIMQLRRGGPVEGVSDPQIGADLRWWLGEDMTLPLRSLSSYLRHARKVAAEHGVRVSHIAHLGDGNLHPSITIKKDRESEADARVRLQAAADALIRFALAEGGALTGEHGIGLAKLPWIDLALAPEIRELHTKIKAAFDPRGILNPGKAI